MAKSLQEMTNRVLALLDEPGSNPGGAPNIPGGATFNQFLITDTLNEGVAAFIADADYMPSVMDKYLQTAIVAGEDFALPTDALAVQRVEYLAGGVGPPMLVPMLDFDEFDVYSGGAYTATDNPQIVRVPFAGMMRFWPYPTAINVTAGDQLILYYTSLGTTLVNLADTVNIPTECQEAPIAYALSRFFSRKHAPADEQLWERRFEAICARAKRKIWANDQAADLTIGDAESPTTNELYWH